MEFKRKGQKLSKPRHRHVECKSAAKCRKNVSNEENADTELEQAPANTPMKTYLSMPCESPSEHKNPYLLGHLTKLHEWLINHKGEYRHCLQIPAKELDILLAEFIMSVRTAWGSQFAPITLRRIANNITHYLAENSHPLGGQAKEFMLFRQVMCQKVHDLEEQKDLIHGITHTTGISQEKIMEKATAFIEKKIKHAGKEFATTLTTRASTSANRQAAWIQYVLRYTITRYFGVRKTEELHTLHWGDFYLDVNDNGIESLKSLKRRDNGKPDPSCSPLCLTGKNDRCAVCLYREFASHRPSSALQSKSPFFLEVIPYDLLQPGSDVWYYPVGLSQDSLRLGAMLKYASYSNASTSDRVPESRGKKRTTSTQMQQGIS